MIPSIRLLSLASLLSLCACGDDGLLSITRDFDGEPVEQVIPAIPPVLPFPLTIPVPAQTIETNARARLQDYGMKEGNLRIAKLKTVTVSIDDPSAGFTLADVRDVVVNAKSANQPTVQIATYAGASSPITTDQMTVLDVDLRDYVLDDPLELTGTLTLLKPTDNPITVRIEFQYEVTGGI